MYVKYILTVLQVLFILFIVFSLLFGYAALRVSSEESRREELMEFDRKFKESEDKE